MSVEAKNPDLLTSDVARALGTSVDNVRRLERKGVLRARRTVGGVRIYDADDVEREVERRRTNAHRS